MRVVTALSIIHYFRHFDKVVRRLSSHGHSVDIVIRHTIKRNTTDRALQAYLAETGTARFQKMAAPGSHKWYVLLWRVREMINYAVYFKTGHSSPQLAQRWSNRLPKTAQIAVKIPLLRKVLVSTGVQKTLRWVQAHIPLDATIVRQFQEDRPDVVFASPFICEHPREADYIRAAIALKIPTVVAVASWDNLTTKGTFHAIPDMVLVWNNALLEEAVRIHDVPREKIIVTGAPTFDFWFDTKPSTSRVSFCREVGLNPDKPFLVYLCSSTSITLEGERSFVEELAANLRAQPDADQVQILVRPHPLNAHIWEGFQSRDIHVWPRGGE